MRVYLGGEGEPIPEEALPDLTQFDGVVTIVLENGVPFHKADYIALGYDAFEVWCFGAAGGAGGDAYGKDFPVDAPESVYAPVSWPYYYTYAAGNPSPIQHWFAPFLSGLTAAGGGGGGGGLHRVAGVLADLPDSVPVVVGSPGVDGNAGILGKENAYTPQPPYWEYGTMGAIWDLPHSSFGPITAGADGGASSFNGTLCRASGGKGGRAATKWVSHARSIDGDGGVGGIGGSSTAGGGAAGAADYDDQGATGSWDGEVGQGGGGGHGGHLYGIDEIEHSGEPLLDTRPPYGETHAPIYATDGGLGSFSYGDTSVYGPRQLKQTIVKIFDGAGNPHWTFKPIVESSINLRGGGGGGAHRDARKFGSRAVGYSPNGLVLIRLIKTG